jgi:hypothetical protein
MRQYFITHEIYLNNTEPWMPGDVAFMDFDGNFEADHVSVISEVAADQMPAKMVHASGYHPTFNPSGLAYEQSDVWGVYEQLLLGHGRLKCAPDGGRNGLAIRVGSPLELTLSDETGRYLDTGFDPLFGVGAVAAYNPFIFTGTFSDIEDTRVFSVALPVSGTYHLDMLGTDDGNYTVEIETWRYDWITDYKVYAGNVSAGEPLGMSITLVQRPEGWLVDAAAPIHSPIIEIAPTSLILTRAQPAGQFVVREVGEQVGLSGLGVVAHSLSTSAGELITNGIALDPQHFDLSPGGLATMTVQINTDNLKPGGYRGSIEVTKDSITIRRIPLLLDISPYAHYFPLVVRSTP